MTMIINYHNVRGSIFNSGVFFVFMNVVKYSNTELLTFKWLKYIF